MVTSNVYYQLGNTVQFSATFSDFQGNSVDPSTISIIFYDENWQKLNEFPITSANKNPSGEYVYNYITNREGLTYYEWNAQIDNLPSIKRGEIYTRMI